MDIKGRRSFVFDFFVSTAALQRRHVIFTTDGEMSGIRMVDIDEIHGHRILADTHHIPTSRVELEETRRKNGEGDVLRVLWAVCALGILGELRFGVTDSGEFTYNRLQENPRFNRRGECHKNGLVQRN